MEVQVIVVDCEGIYLQASGGRLWQNTAAFKGGGGIGEATYFSILAGCKPWRMYGFWHLRLYRSEIQMLKSVKTRSAAACINSSESSSMPTSGSEQRIVKNHLMKFLQVCNLPNMQNFRRIF